MKEYLKPMNNYHQEIKAIVRPGSIVFIIVFDLLVIILLKKKLFEINNLVFLVSAVAGTFFFLLKPVFSKRTITISDEFMVVRKLLFNIAYQSTSYQIKEINQPAKRTNVAEDSFWGGNGFRIYDRTPAVLTFNYKNKSVEIGRSFLLPDVDEVIREIRTRQRS